MNMKTLISKGATAWAKYIYRHPLIVLITAVVLTILAFHQMMSISVSTQINALMPKGAKSVQTLNRALEKTGSFAAIQIVVEAPYKSDVLESLAIVKDKIDTYDWVNSSQYFEDIEVLENHKLLLLSLEDLLQLESNFNQAYPVYIAKRIRDIFGTEARFTLRNENLTGHSSTELDTSELGNLDQLTQPRSSEKRRYFLSDDGLTGVLIVWPKAGQESLIASKQMVDDSYQLIDSLASTTDQNITFGVGGRIASQVSQFDSIIRDLKLGLASAIVLIIVLLVVFYRSFVAIPVILIPLVLGIIATLGFTAITIGNLNLITVFLTLILFGLGIDFAIHNLSRYLEERRSGVVTEDAIKIVMTETGAASLMAALTTALSFFALIFTEFRAFSEFGMIAGSGIAFICVSMYSVQPALLVLAERHGWRPGLTAKTKPSLKMPFILNALNYRKPIIFGVIGLIVFSAIFAPQMRFETNTKNLEAKMPERHIMATKRIQKVIKVGNSRAIIVSDNYSELVQIHNYFDEKIKADQNTPSIKSVSSILDFVPDPESQKQRLDVIKRLSNRAQSLQGFDPNRYAANEKFLTIETLNISDLPESLKRTYLGQDRPPELRGDPTEQSYLIYVDNAVNMDDAAMASLFYDDVAKFSIQGQDYYAASESFILIEMLGLMKSDALKAVLLVTLTTSLMAFVFFKNIIVTIIVLAPTFLGMAATVGIMGAFGPSLSIMNMVILPSLVGISVDNSIHIIHRFETSVSPANIETIMDTTGRASVLTTLTTLIGFGGMITASMTGLRSLAILSIVGFLACLVMTWIVLPVLLDSYQTWVLKKQNKFESHLS